MRLGIIAFLVLGLPAGEVQAAPAATQPPAAKANPEATPATRAAGPAKKGKKSAIIYPAQRRPPVRREDFKLEARPKKEGDLKIVPKDPIKQLAMMVLRKHAVKPGTLVLELKVKDPTLTVSRKAAVVQLYPDEEIEVGQDIFVNNDWPKNDLVEIKYKMLKPGGPYLVQGEGAFTLCRKSNQVCEAKIIPFALELP